jgi:hypothetical protein
MLERPAASTGTLGKTDLPLKLPTRVITCAWGEKYIGELLSITLPALLAPGNLPYVASVVPCELVILTERASFSRLLRDVTVRKILQLCAVRFIEIDDLIPSPDQYGMAITYALHRGFSDLGQSATDTWLLFLNADFIPADGGFRNVIQHLAQGKRLVAAPSYCVKAEGARPELLARMDLRSRALSIPFREMARLILEHQHDSIRGKTVNEASISIRYMDQFYWRVDPNTLAGHQMPVAIVGMRPERNLPEPNSFWDYGLIREFCPNTEHCVIGDSDEFLMLELRHGHVTETQEWIVRGWPEPSEIARNMITFATPYTKDMARHPLTLHSGELPEGIEDARAKLRAFVDSVFSHLPAVLPSHLGHPQFDYHWSTFMEARHRYLSRRLGSITETEEPSCTLSELDRVWWKLDGVTKAYSRKHAQLTDLMLRQQKVVAELQARQQDAHLNRLNQLEARLQNEVLTRLDQEMTRDLSHDNKKPAELYGSVHLLPDATASTDGDPSAANESAWMEPTIADAERFVSETAEKNEFLANMQPLIERRYNDRLLMLEVEFEITREKLQLDYERLLRRLSRSATVPHVVTWRGLRAPAARSHDSSLRAMARSLYRRCYGKLPRVRPVHPYWAAMRHLIHLVDTATNNKATNVLVVSSGGGLADTLADHLPGLHAQVSLPEFLGGNFAKAFHEPTKFDLCICSLGPSDLLRFRDVAQMAGPYMSTGGKVIGFYPNFGLRSLSANEIAMLCDPRWSKTVYYAGSAESARAIRKFYAALGWNAGSRLAKLVRVATMLLTVTPMALAANRSEAADPQGHSSRLPEHCTSITIEVTA